MIGFLHDTWQISVGFLVVIAKPSSNTWCFVIGCIHGLGSVTCQLVIGHEFSLSTNAPLRLVHAHNFGVWYGNEFRKLIFTLDFLSEGVEGGGAFNRMR